MIKSIWHFLVFHDLFYSVYRDTKISELQFGQVNFDNIFLAFLTVFQCLTLEGWTSIMYNYQDTYGRYVTAIYFVALVSICALLFMNIIVAILFDNYEDNDTGDQKQELIELEEKAESLGIPTCVSDIIIKKDLVLGKLICLFNLSLITQCIDAKSKTPSSTLMKRYCHSLVSKDEKLKIPKGRYFKNKYVQFLFRLVNHPTFNLFIFVVIGINMITLSMDIYSHGTGTLKIGVLEYFNYCFFAIYTVEVLLKIIGLGCRLFVKDKFNLFDAFVVLISLLEIILARGSGTFASLRAFRLFRVFKIFRVGDLRILIDCLTKTMKAISPFVI